MKKIILSALTLAVLSGGTLNAQTKPDPKAPAKPAAGKNTLPPPMKAPAPAPHATMPLPKPGGTQQVKPVTMPMPAARPVARPVVTQPAKPAPVSVRPMPATRPVAKTAMPMPAAKPAHAKPAVAARKHTAVKKHVVTRTKTHRTNAEVMMPAPPPPPAPVMSVPSRPADVEVNKYVERPSRDEGRDNERESTYAHHGHDHGEDFDYNTRRAWRQHYRMRRREMRWHHHTHCADCSSKYDH